MDKRNQFLTNYKTGKINNILYTYHQDMAKKIMSTAEFALKLQTLHILSMTADRFGAPLFDFDGFKNFVVKHYMIKFTVYKVFDKENQLVDVY